MFGKKDEYCGPDESDTKLSVLEELRDMAMGMMGEKVDKKMKPEGDMKQVTVASDDPEGLEHGLEMAKEVAGGHEAGPESFGSEHSLANDDMSVEEIEAMIQELEDKKRQKLMSV